MSRKIMPYIAASLLIAVMLAGCGQAVPVSGGSGDSLSVVTTIFPPYDFTRAIAGDMADISMLLPPATESHSFEPTPQDVIKILNCDVFIYVGGESDEWVTGVLETMDTSGMDIITLMDCVELVEEELTEGMESGGAHGEEPEYDEHIWTSPRNAKLVVQKISDTLRALDPENADYYGTNTDAYIAELDKLDVQFQNVVNNAVRKTIVFGDRFPFRYFADAYGLEYFAAFPGCSAETEPSAATVKFLIDKINAERIPVVFHIELSNRKMAEIIGEGTGARILPLHSCHSITKTDFEAGITYLDIMYANADALEAALQ